MDLMKNNFCITPILMLESNHVGAKTISSQKIQHLISANGWSQERLLQDQEIFENMEWIAYPPFAVPKFFLVLQCQYHDDDKNHGYQDEI
jgi:hypothetical protein